MNSAPERIWYFDVISPFAYLQWQRLKRVPNLTLIPRPILLGAVLNHLQQRGPAEIPAKRIFTYRMVHWRAQQQNVPLRFPPSHPFNPMQALRLIIAAENSMQAVERVMSHIWLEGRALDDAASVLALGAALGIANPQAAIAQAHVKAALRSNTEEALAFGVFGVPTLRLGSDLFWGDDATDLALAAAHDPHIFRVAPYAGVENLPASAARKLP